MRRTLQIVGAISALGAAMLGIWLSQLPALIIGSYWQSKAMTICVLVSAVTQAVVLWLDWRWGS
jgi:hypothetical protein